MAEPAAVQFGIVGGGWWAEMYLRIAASLAQFEVSGMVVRREEAGRVLEDQWGVRTFRTVEDMTAALSGEQLLFVVIAVPQPANAAMLKAVVESGVPALGQTPSGWTLQDCIELHESVTLAGKRVQIAEQYHMQPIHQARLALMNSGKLGEISQAQVSVATAYHGTSLARVYLDISAELCTVRAIQHEAPLMDGIGRYSSASGAQTVDKRQGGLRNAVHGPKDGSEAVVADEESAPSSQTLAWLQFDNGKLAVCDWSGDQYYSSIRSTRVLVRGERGEVNNTTARYLLSTATPAVEYDLRRVDVGPTETWGNSLLGDFHRGYLGGSEWLFLNPFAPPRGHASLEGRLTDDELANVRRTQCICILVMYRRTDMASLCSLCRRLHSRKWPTTCGLGKSSTL